MRALGGFWACVVLAFLSHLAFLIIYVGFVAWSARRTASVSSLEQLRKLAAIHAVPGAFLVFYWFTAIRGMHIEGGPPSVAEEMLLSLVSRGLGGPGAGWLAVGVAMTGLALFAAGLARLIRAGDDVWVFFAVAVLASPLLVLVRRPPFLFERYFALPWVFFLIVLAHGLKGLLPTRGGARGWGCWIVFLLLLGIPRRQHPDFPVLPQPPARPATRGHRLDRGPGRAADRRRRQRLPRPHRACLPRPRAAVAVRRRRRLPPGGASWLVVHHVDASFEVSKEAEDADGNVYELARAWPSTGLADWGWFVFRNAGRKRK